MLSQVARDLSGGRDEQRLGRATMTTDNLAIVFADPLAEFLGALPDKGSS
jgi:hypothetical protein